MISIYLEWNVIAQLKNGSIPKLREVLDSQRFLIPYSTSHIGDIFSSYEDDPKQQEQIKEDLEFISELTKKYFLSNEVTTIRLDLVDPKELFQDKIDDKDLLKNISLEMLTGIFDSDEQTKEFYQQAIENLKKMPLDESLVQAFENPQLSEHMNILFPDLKENLTMEGFFKSFGEMIVRMNETEAYKKIREITQNGLGINRDKIYNTNDPYKFISDKYQNLNIDPKESKFEGCKNAPAWFDEISNEYIKLDMHGFQQDKVNTGKGRKETFRNTLEDAFHAAFASTCNFYITNDKKSFEKTQKVYELLDLKTLVFRPDEFVNYYNAFLSKRDFDVDLTIPIRFKEANKYVERQIDDGYIRTYHLPYFVFDFFNKMIVKTNKSGLATMIVLDQMPPTNKGITYFFEIENLSPKLYRVLGMDAESLGPIKIEELDQKEWQGRRWWFKNLSFRFIRVDGHYQLYYDYPDVAEVANDD